MAELFQQLKAAFAERYQLEIELGSGGMATVYLAVDPHADRRVALKVLHPRWAGAVGHERFLQEIRFASELNHPHILPLLDSGTVAIGGHSLPWYTMPFVEGESLRARLSRQKQLPIDAALAIARDVAAALAYAHAHDVVHRDIKPENILLAGSEAVVADFGIARAINRSADATIITTYNMAVGTPHYMSPEQSLAAQEIDGRSDIYSLGCVLYEMLGGTPPFTGATPQAIVARHQLDPVPSLTTIRPTVPLGLELTVKKALQKQAADRFQSAEDLMQALSTAVSGAVPTIETRGFTGRQRFWAALVILLLAVGGTLAAIFFDGTDGPSGEPMDTTLFAVFPAQPAAGQQDLDPSLLLQDALAGWQGVNLVVPFQVRSARQRETNPRSAAAALGAGRYITLETGLILDSMRVHATLYDTRSNIGLAEGTVRVGASLAGAGPAFSSLAERLLFRGKPHPQSVRTDGTMSMPARQSFARGYDAIERWDLLTADSAFDAATRIDPDYADAALWLALTRVWAGREPETWQSAAERTAAGRPRLALRDRKVSDAVLALARRDAARSCAIWRQLTRDHPQDFVSWYGFADCQTADSGVVRDPGSPSRWRFRTSYHSALAAYQQAFKLLPSIHQALRAGSFEGVRRLFKTNGRDLRIGRAVAPDTGVFVAYPTWEGDSLAFHPYPMARITEARRRSTTVADAVQHQRELFHRVARSWVVEFPRSSAALEGLGLSLELIGSPAALDTIHRARELATSEEERIRLAGAEVWLKVKFSVPHDTAGIREARVLAESLLAVAGSRPARPRLLAGLALLVGKTGIAVELSRSNSFREDWSTIPALSSLAPAMLTYAASGGPADSLLQLESKVNQAIDNFVASSDQQSERLRWIARSASLVFPEVVFHSIPILVGQGDYLINAIAASLAGDTGTVRAVLKDLEITRRGIRPADRVFEAILPEARLWMALGDDRSAIAWIDPTLRALPGIGPGVLDDPVVAGALIRVLALRSELARRVGDQDGAREWALPVSILLEHADQEQQRLRQAMRRNLD